MSKKFEVLVVRKVRHCYVLSQEVEITVDADNEEEAGQHTADNLRQYGVDGLDWNTVEIESRELEDINPATVFACRECEICVSTGKPCRECDCMKCDPQPWN